MIGNMERKVNLVLEAKDFDNLQQFGRNIYDLMLHGDMGDYVELVADNHVVVEYHYKDFDYQRDEVGALINDDVDLYRQSSGDPIIWESLSARIGRNVLYPVR